MISVDEALAKVLEHVVEVADEAVPLALSAGRILRQSVFADRDQPPFDRAAMDGFAVRAADLESTGVTLRIMGDVRAGQWPDKRVAPGEAIRIMTGAPVPDGADAVVQVEKTRPVQGEGDAGPEVLVEATAAAGQNIVRRGTEAQRGSKLLDPGSRIGPPQIAVLASVGVIQPMVSSRPRVAVLVTGDEVIDPAAAPTPAQIRNANGPALMAAIADAGGVAIDFGVIADDPERTREAIDRALKEGHEAIILSGGVSAGAFDFVEGALADLGVTLHITAVRVKPGAPSVFGTRGSTLVFGLPGNPVSAQVTFELFVRPALLKMQGARRLFRPAFEAKLDGSLSNRSGRRNYVPVAASWTDAVLMARPISTQGSGDVVAHAKSDALAILEPEQTSIHGGEPLILHPLSSFLEV